MQACRIETRVTRDGTLTIKGLPFRAGDKVEVIVRRHKHEEGQAKRYPLRGKPVRYTEPFSNVAEGDWEALR
jgi:hypothetical protein